MSEMIVKNDSCFVVRVDEIPQAGWERELHLDDTWLGSVLGIAYVPAGFGLDVALEARKLEASVEAAVRLTSRVRFDCSRCAESAELPVSLKAMAIFIPEEAHRIRLADAEDAGQALENLLPIVDGELDLEPVVVDLLALELDLYPVCSAECKGLCAGCGVNLNLETCRCDVSAVDTRFAVLAKWKNTHTVRDKG